MLLYAVSLHTVPQAPPAQGEELPFCPSLLHTLSFLLSETPVPAESSAPVSSAVALPGCQIFWLQDCIFSVYKEQQKGYFLSVAQGPSCTRALFMYSFSALFTLVSECQ